MAALLGQQALLGSETVPCVPLVRRAREADHCPGEACTALQTFGSLAALCVCVELLGCIPLVTSVACFTLFSSLVIIFMDEVLCQIFF